MLDRQGRVRYTFNHQVVAGLRQGKDRVFVTSHDVARLTADHKARWVVPFEDPEWIVGGGLVEVRGGDLLAFLYSEAADSGVQLMRLNAAGKVVWRRYCRGLGVAHSEYSHHAKVAVEGNSVCVTSKGSEGTFVELLDLQTGKQLKRTVSKR